MKRVVEAVISIFVILLENFGLRCSECGSWGSCVIACYNFEWGTDVGGMLFMDPFYRVTSKCICLGCGHRMWEKFAGCVSTDEIEDTLSRVVSE